MEFFLLSALILPFASIPLVLWLGSRLGPRTGWIGVAVAGYSLLNILFLAQTSGMFMQREVSYTWVPSLGLQLSFLVDGLSVFYGVVVSGMGVLVCWYGSQYLDHHYRDHGRFYAYLMLFMGAMLGTVFSENLFVLFIFWELTGVASFLLIGFSHHKEDSRNGARMALLVTLTTGLAMLAGIVLLWLTGGTFSILELADSGVTSLGMVAGVSMVLILLGAFGKSAQFPFHFWLPNAMAAPTPVSAYLHSATMVKLGVFLVARLFPIFDDLPLWTMLLMLVGFTTMVWGAWLALVSHDLKAILAFSTVSQLGFLIGFYGLGGFQGVHYDFLHIANHVFYKGCLFMVAGIIDHSTGTRDIRQLGGLWKSMPMLGIIAAIGLASMAGLPGTIGFISKEYMLKEKFLFFNDDVLLNWFPIVMVGLASILKVAFSARFFIHVFWRPAPAADHPHGHGHSLHPPGMLIMLPPLLLAGACLIFGLFPGWMTPALQHLAVPGLHLADIKTLQIWHGVSREFILSAVLVAVGFLLYAGLSRIGWTNLRIPGLARFDVGFESFVQWIPYGAAGWSRFLRDGRPADYLPVIAISLSLLLGGHMLMNLPVFVDQLVSSPSWMAVSPLRLFIVVLILFAVTAVVLLPRWTTQLISISIVGFLVTFYFVLFRAPDLAMTQILVESATLLLVLLLLARFPHSSEKGEHSTRLSKPRKLLNVLTAVGVGTCMMFLTWTMPNLLPEERVGAYFLANTVEAAKGTNAVNTVLVDFRGFDTLLEIAVLLIALLGAMGLLTRYRRTREEYRLGATGPAGFGINRGSKSS